MTKKELLNEYYYEKLTKSHDLSNFSCGVKDLDAFLEKALNHVDIFIPSSLICPFAATQQTFFNPSIMVFEMSHSGRKYH